MEQLVFVSDGKPTGGLKGLMDYCEMLRTTRQIAKYDYSPEVLGVTITLWPPSADVLREKQPAHDTKDRPAHEKAQAATYQEYKEGIVAGFAGLGFEDWTAAEAERRKAAAAKADADRKAETERKAKEAAEAVAAKNKADADAIAQKRADDETKAKEEADKKAAEAKRFGEEIK